MADKKLSDLANEMEERFGRNGVIFTAEDYEKVKHRELPKHDAKQAMQQYIEVMRATEGIDWNKAIADIEAAQANAMSAPPTISNNIPMPVDGGYEESDDAGFDNQYGE